METRAVTFVVVGDTGVGEPVGASASCAFGGGASQCDALLELVRETDADRRQAAAGAAVRRARCWKQVAMVGHQTVKNESGQEE